MGRGRQGGGQQGLGDWEGITGRGDGKGGNGEGDHVGSGERGRDGEVRCGEGRLGGGKREGEKGARGGWISQMDMMKCLGGHRL